jgi:hypothetical protein
MWEKSINEIMLCVTRSTVNVIETNKVMPTITCTHINHKVVLYFYCALSLDSYNLQMNFFKYEI